MYETYLQIFNVLFLILTKKTYELKQKKTLGFKKRIYWLKGTKEDKIKLLNFFINAFFIECDFDTYIKIHR